MALVLAIDPEHRQEQALGRLKRELAGHEVVIAGSAEEALDVIDQCVPDLVLFPLLLSPGDEDALTSRLRNLSGPDRVQTLTIPLLASEESERVAPTTTKPRWFYWFKPPEDEGVAPSTEPHMFAEAIRTYLKRGRQTPEISASPRQPVRSPAHVEVPPSTRPAPASVKRAEIRPSARPPAPVPVPRVEVRPIPPPPAPAPMPRVEVRPSPPPPVPAPMQYVEVRPTSPPPAPALVQWEAVQTPPGVSEASRTPTRQKKITLKTPSLARGLTSRMLPSAAARRASTAAVLRTAAAILSLLIAASTRAASALGTAASVLIKAIAASGARIGLALANVVRLARRMAGGATGVTWRGMRWVGSVPIPGARWFWYATPALVLGAAVILAIGIPRAKAWLSARPLLATAELQSVPRGSEVFVDGDRIGVTPLTTALPAGTHQVEFRYAGAMRTETLDIGPGERVQLRVDWKRAPTGRLRLTSDPEGAAVTVDGTKRGFTPLTLEDLAPGQHVVTLKHTAGFVRRTVRIKANETATLEASIYSGWLALFSPIELKISEGGRQMRLDEQNQLMLPPGRHDLELSNSALGYRESQIVEVRPGEVTAVSIAVPKSAVTVTSTPSAEVWLDGVKVGETPLADLSVAIGTREFVLKNATLGARRVMATVTVRPSHIDVDFTKPEI